MTDSKPVEILVLEEVYDAAMLRARSQGQPLASVARDIVWAASQRAEPVPGGSVAHPAQRPPKSGRRRVRFTAPKAAYEVARDRIRGSGKSVAQALEDGLESYARTGAY